MTWALRYAHSRSRVWMKRSALPLVRGVYGRVRRWRSPWPRRPQAGAAGGEVEAATPNGDGSLSRVRRGDSWGDDGYACRSAFRLKFEPDRRFDHIGFRVVVVRP